MREERKRIGISQADAGLLAGVSREQWSRYEGGAMPGSDALLRLQGHGFDLNYVLGGARTLGESTMSDDEERLLQAFRVTDAEGKTAVLRAAQMEAMRCRTPANPYDVPAPRPAPTTLHEPASKPKRRT